MHPIALELLEHMKMPSEGMRSKSREEFAKPGAPRLDFVFTVRDNAAGEMCPIWPGQPMTAHWGVADPAAVEGSDTEKWLAIRSAFRELESRIKIFTSASRFDRSIARGCRSACTPSARRPPLMKWPEA